MATQRYISTSFWDDEWIAALDPSEKLLYMYFLTNPLTNIAGVYEITFRRISFDTGFNFEMIEKIIKRFQKDKKAYYFNKYIILPTWPKHQKWEERSQIKKGIVNCLKALPQEIFEYLNKVGYQYPINTISISYTYEPNYIDPDSDINSETDKDSDKDFDQEVRKACLSVGLILPDNELLKLSRNIKQQSVNSGFIKYAYTKIRGQPDIKKPLSVLKYICMNPQKYQDYYKNYLDKAS